MIVGIKLRRNSKKFTYLGMVESIYTTTRKNTDFRCVPEKTRSSEDVIYHIRLFEPIKKVRRGWISEREYVWINKVTERVVILCHRQFPDGCTEEDCKQKFQCATIRMKNEVDDDTVIVSA
jgi:hypothetical protein